VERSKLLEKSDINLDALDEIEWKYLSYGKTIGAIKAAKIIKELFPNSTSLLDIGCGGGGLAHFVRNYTGLDYSQNAVECAARTNRNSGAHFVCSDAAKSPFANSSFDTVLSISLLEHMENQTTALQEAFRVCRKNAIFILPCRDTFGFLYDPVNFILRKLGTSPIKHGAFGYGHTNLRSQSEWIEMIETNGFQIDTILPYDNSALGQIEFCLFSFLTPGREYEDIPVSSISKRLLNFVNFFHRFFSLIDFQTSTSFCQCFIASKPS